jgi:hypothetical protein
MSKGCGHLYSGIAWDSGFDTMASLRAPERRVVISSVRPQISTMSNDKAQMSNQAQNPKCKPESVWHSGIWVSIVIWILTFGFVQFLRFDVPIRF